MNQLRKLSRIFSLECLSPWYLNALSATEAITTVLKRCLCMSINQNSGLKTLTSLFLSSLTLLQIHYSHAQLEITSEEVVITILCSSMGGCRSSSSRDYVYICSLANPHSLFVPHRVTSHRELSRPDSRWVCVERGVCVCVCPCVLTYSQGARWYILLK